MQIVDLGEGENSISESTKLDEVAKKTTEIEKGQGSLKLISQALKNPFAPPIVVATLAKRKMFKVESLGTASKVISLTRKEG